MKFPIILLCLFIPLSVYAQPPLRWFMDQQYIELEDYEKKDWKKIRELFYKKAPESIKYFNLFNQKKYALTETDEDNLYELENVIDFYITLNTASDKQIAIDYVQSLTACWRAITKYHKEKSDTLKTEIDKLSKLASEKSYTYKVLVLQHDKIDYEEGLKETIADLKDYTNNKSDKLEKIKSKILEQISNPPLDPQWWKNKTVPDISLNDLQSKKPFKLSELKGQVVYLDFWATWCGPCQEPMKHLNELAKKQKSNWKDKVQLIGISLDTKAELALKHLKKKNWLECRQTWPNNGWESEASKAFNIDGVPSAFLINQDGKIIWAGHPAEIDLEKKITSLLNKTVSTR